MDWRALSQSARSSCLPPDRDRRSNEGILAVGCDWSAFELKEAYGTAFVGSGVTDMALHLWRSIRPSVHRIRAARLKGPSGWPQTFQFRLKSAELKIPQRYLKNSHYRKFALYRPHGAAIRNVCGNRIRPLHCLAVSSR